MKKGVKGGNGKERRRRKEKQRLAADYLVARWQHAGFPQSVFGSGAGDSGAGLRVTSSRRAASSPRPLLPASRRCATAWRWCLAPLAGPALLGWLRVPWPLAFCPASPGGGRKAIIAQRRSTYLGRLCKARGRESPGQRLSRLSGQACARGRGANGGPRGLLRVFRWSSRFPLRESAAA